jgi:hypothetical protein
VIAARRMSPRVLIDQLSAVGDQIAMFWQTVDLVATGYQAHQPQNVHHGSFGTKRFQLPER